MYAHIFKNERSLFSTWQATILCQGSLESHLWKVHLMADGGPSRRYVGDIQTPFHKVCSTGWTLYGPELCAAIRKKSVIKI